MSYRVEYGSDAVPKGHPPRGRFRLVALAAVCFLLFLFCVNTFYPRGREVMVQLFLAGGGEELISAVSNLSQELEQGLPLSAAVQTFCRELAGGY